MKRRNWAGLFLCLLMTMTVLAGCSSKVAYTSKEFNGISFKFPEAWGEPSMENSNELSYNFDTEGGGKAIFYIYSFSKDTYKSRFYNEEEGYYKGAYLLNTTEQLNNKLDIMSFYPIKEIWKDNKPPENMMLLSLVETDEYILEFTMDLPQKYYENDKKIVESVYNSIKIVN